MNKLRVAVNIKSRQTMEDGSVESFAAQATGYLYEKTGAIYLNYMETQTAGEPDIQVTWKIEPAAATLIRSGNAQLRLRFASGTEDYSNLITPHGNLPVEIETILLDSQLNELGGTLRVVYKMSLGGIMTRMDLAVDVLPA